MRTPPTDHEAPRQHGRRTLVLGLLLTVGVLLGCAGCGGLADSFVSPAPEARPEHRAAVLNIDDVHGWVNEGPAPNLAYERLTIGPAVLGTREWDYEYEPPESYGQLSFVTSSRHDESSVSEAKSAFSTRRVGASLGIRLGADDMDLAEADELLVWGDQIYFARMVSEGETLGHVVVARRDKTVLFAGFGLISFEDKESVDRYLVPVLERAANYRLPEP